MGTRPTPDGKPLNEDDQRLMNDFSAVMEKARARRRELIHERREQPAYIGTKHQGTAVIYRPIGGDWNYDPGTWVQLEDGKWVQKEHAVEWIEVEENRFVQKEHEEELRVLERALLPLAKRARTHGQQLFSLFRPDLP